MMAKDCCAAKRSVDQIRVGKQEVGIADLEGILRRTFEHTDASDDELKAILLKELKEHNYVPASVEKEYLRALWEQFKSFRAEQKGWIEEKYHGIPREEIQWYPTVDEDKCTGCGVCVDMCHRGVYFFGGKAKVTNPYRCVVSCTGCASMCPEGAISFPTLVRLREDLKQLRAKYRLEE